jgi:hypothetical protein
MGGKIGQQGAKRKALVLKSVYAKKPRFLAGLFLNFTEA